MKTRVFRIDLVAEPNVELAIAQACDKQLNDGFKLASTFVWQLNLVLIFQSS